MTLKELKEPHPDHRAQHNFNLCVCVVKGELPFVEKSGEVIQLRYANQMKGVNEKISAAFSAPVPACLQRHQAPGPRFAHVATSPPTARSGKVLKGVNEI